MGDHQIPQGRVNDDGIVSPKQHGCFEFMTTKTDQHLVITDAAPKQLHTHSTSVS